MVQSVDHAADKALQYWEWDADRCVLCPVMRFHLAFGTGSSMRGHSHLLRFIVS